MSQKTLNLCLERYNFVKFGETTKSSHTVLCINNANNVNSAEYRLTPAAIASKHGDGYVFTLNYDFDRPLFTIVQKSYSLDGTSGNIVFEGIDPISKGGSKYLRKVTVSPVKLSDGSYLLEVTSDEYLRIGTTGAALGDEELESLNEKIITIGGITKSVETVGGKQVLKLDAGGPSGAKEIVYFEIDPSDPPSGLYSDITVALSNDKEPVIKNDDDIYFYSSKSSDKYIFVGGYNTEVVNYSTITVSDDDSVVKETVDTIEGMVFPLYYHSVNGEFTVADKTGHALTKTEIANAYKAGQIFMFSSYPASNTQAHWGYCCDINIYSDNTGYAEFFILSAVGGDSYAWEKYRIILSSNTEFVTLEGPNTSYSTGYSGHFADGDTTVSVSTSQSFSTAQKAQGRSNIGAASASDVTALQSQVSSLSDVSAYSVKGEATVAQLNAGPSGIQAGWVYQLTDSGTLTDGTLAVVAGDTVAWDGTKWFPLVKSDYYAAKTYAQNVAHSIAPPFDPTRTSENPYKAGETVMYTDGKAYTFKVNHYGAWNDDDVEPSSSVDLYSRTRVDYTFVTGKYINTDGTEATLSGYNVTDFVKVDAGVTIDITHVYLIANASLAFYDSDKNFVSILDETGITSLGNAHVQTTVPSGCCYVRWTYKDSYVSECRIVSTLKDFVQKSITPIETEFNTLYQVQYTPVTGKYINTDGTEATLSGYNATDFVFAPPGSIIDITHVYLTANASLAFYDCEKKFVSILDETGITILGNAHIRPTMPNGCYYLRWTYKDTYVSEAVIKSPNLAQFVKKSIDGIRTKKLPPLATLVDDDSFLDYTPNIKSACDANGVKCSFAVIWTKLQNDSALLNLLKTYQEEGYNIIDHPQGPNWGTSAATFNLANAEQMLVQSLVYLKTQGFLDCDHFVAPGGYVNSEVLSLAEKWCKSGIGRNNGKPNHLAQDGKYNLHRLFIGEHDTDTLADYTPTIDSAYANGDWLIFGCHSYNINTPEKIQLLTDVIAYAKTKGFVFKTYNAAIKERAVYFDAPQLI